MMLRYLCGVLLFAVPCTTQGVLIQPEQVHISYGDSPTEMIVIWITISKVEPSQVVYGLDPTNMSNKVIGSNATLFKDGGDEHRIMYIHHVRLRNLKPDMQYYYHVGSPLGWSDMFYFRSMKAGTTWSPTITIFGDMGNAQSFAMATLQEMAQSGKIDSILHIGDFAYDMDSDNARVGDAFMNQIQAVAAYVPYMTCPGNHEEKYNFSNYKNRFSMPEGRDLYYSYNIGPAHIITISTEFYYYDTYNLTDGLELAAKQYKWLQQDLAEANEKRSDRPWLIVVGHRPMYCSNNDGPSEHCNNFESNFVRTGTADKHLFALEDLFYKAGVDLQFYAHEHSYERLYPVYNLTVCNGSSSAYEDPRAPVHVITGSAGNDEGQTGFDKKVYPWSAFHSRDYGFTQLHIVNTTHIELQQISINKGGDVIDSMTLVKHKHGAGLYDCHLRH